MLFIILSQKCKFYIYEIEYSIACNKITEGSKEYVTPKCIYIETELTQYKHTVNSGLHDTRGYRQKGVGYTDSRLYPSPHIRHVRYVG